MFGIPLNIYILKAIPSRKLTTRLSVMKTALPKKTAQRLKAQFQVIPCCHYASLNFARQPQERIIIWSATSFLCCFDQQRHQQNILQWAKSSVDARPTGTEPNPHCVSIKRLIACGALVAVTNNFWSL